VELCFDHHVALLLFFHACQSGSSYLPTTITLKNRFRGSFFFLLLEAFFGGFLVACFLFFVLSWILLLLSIGNLWGFCLYVCVCVCVLHRGDEEGKNVKRNGFTRCFVATPPKKKPDPPAQKTKEEPKAGSDGFQEDCLG
jgi:hypothetical protein